MAITFSKFRYETLYYLLEMEQAIEINTLSKNCTILPKQKKRLLVHNFIFFSSFFAELFAPSRCGSSWY